MVNQTLQLQPRTLAAAASETIRRQILAGQLAPGTKINQARLAQNLGISLVPLREALRKLEAEGLVRIVPHRGAFVTPISRDELEDLYAIRVLLEGMATRAAVSRMTGEDLTQLARLLSEMEQETPKEDYADLLQLNREYHLTIYQASGRHFLCELIESLWEKSARYRALYVYLPGRSVQALEEHREIFRGLQNRWVKEAVRAVRNNIRQTMIGLLAAYDKTHESEGAPSESGLPEDDY